MVPDILSRLRTATNDLHHSVEQCAYGEEIKNCSISLNQYQELIYKNYYIHRHIDDAFQEYLKQFPSSFLQKFVIYRSNWLAQDVSYFSTASSKHFHNLPTFQFSNPAQILGCLYVIEGSMLGGNLIWKHLQKTKSLNAIEYFHFYEKGSLTVRERWLQFMQLLKSYPWSEEEMMLAEDAACKTFELYLTVYQSN